MMLSEKSSPIERGASQATKRTEKWLCLAPAQNSSHSDPSSSPFVGCCTWDRQPSFFRPFDQPHCGEYTRQPFSLVVHVHAHDKGGRAPPDFPLVEHCSPKATTHSTHLLCSRRGLYWMESRPPSCCCQLRGLPFLLLLLSVYLSSSFLPSLLSPRGAPPNPFVHYVRT